jgi:hypothetical protein
MVRPVIKEITTMMQPADSAMLAHGGHATVLVDAGPASSNKVPLVYRVLPQSTRSWGTPHGGVRITIRGDGFGSGSEDCVWFTGPSSGGLGAFPVRQYDNQITVFIPPEPQPVVAAFGHADIQVGSPAVTDCEASSNKVPFVLWDVQRRNRQTWPARNLLSLEPVQ